MKLPKVLGEARSIGGRLTDGASTRAVSGALAAPVAAGTDLAPQLAIPGQTQDFWCWAAVTEGVWRFFDAHGAKTQCDIATQNLPTTPAGGCCATVTGGPCDKPYRLDYSLSRAGYLDRRIDSSLPFADVVTEIDARRPLGVRIQWPDGGGHFVVVSAWSRPSADAEYVVVQDPKGPKIETMPISRLTSAYSSLKGAWRNSYLTTSSPTGGGGVAAMAYPDADDQSLLGG